MENNMHEEIYPVPRNLDSVFVRVTRNGRVYNRCFTDLTDDEQKTYLQTLNTEGLERMCMLMAGAVRGIGDLFGLSFVEAGGLE